MAITLACREVKSSQIAGVPGSIPGQGVYEMGYIHGEKSVRFIKAPSPPDFAIIFQNLRVKT